MKVELTRDVSHLLTKGNRYTATEDVVGQVKITIKSEMTIPAEFYRRVEYRIPDGTQLVEGHTYDLTVRQEYGVNRGAIKNLRGRELLYVQDDYGKQRGRFVLRSGYGGSQRSIRLDDIVTAKEIEAPKETE